ncbi:MAG: ASPIC/UnbV domain-containing protein, partial [Acidobacteriota bacterium]|nr:ASPIC/UnbV domain-containing protein [Acidobacteriota bacterium]
VSDTSRVFLNSATTPLAFTDVSATSGFNDAFWGSALVAFDHDRDGDLDLLQTCAPGGPAPADLRLLDNQSTLAASNKYLVVQPRMSGTNHRAIGAVVRITVGSQQMMRLISAGSSFLGQEPAEAFFGVGDVLIVDQVTVEWPDGTTTQRTNVNPNQVLLVTTGPDADGDGVADFADPDDDNDGTIDSQDCLPLDDQAWSLPQATGSLVMTASNPATLEWGAPPLPGSLSWTFDTIATSVADDFLGAASCLESAGVDTQTVDMDPALPGSIRYYLTRATNLCGHGDGGMTSGGAARTVRSCP